jgi:hypothetical protein
VVADVIVDAFTDINTVCIDKWKDEQVESMMGPDGLPVWVKFKPQVLKGVEYLMDVDPDSSLPETKATREQKAINLYGILRTNPLITPEGLTKYLLRELHGVAFDDLMRKLGNMRQEPGGNPNQPISMEDYVRQTALAQQKAPQAGGGGR